MVRALHQEAAASTKASAAAAADDAGADATISTCRPEHGFHAFDAIYCALTRAHPVKPLFPNDDK